MTKVQTGATLQTSSNFDARVAYFREGLGATCQKIRDVLVNQLTNPDLSEHATSTQSTRSLFESRASRTPPSCLARICQAISSKVRSLLSTIGDMFSRVFNRLNTTDAQYSQVRRDSDAPSDLSSRSSSSLLAGSRERLDSDASDEEATTHVTRSTIAQRLREEIRPDEEYAVWKSNRAKHYILPSRQVCEMILEGGKVEEQFCLKKALKLKLRQDECETIRLYGAELVDRILNLETPASISTGRLAVLAQRTKGLTPN